MRSSRSKATVSATTLPLWLTGSALPLLSQIRTALTAMLPADFTVQGEATLIVESGGSRSHPYLAPVATAAPGVYSVDGTGLGQGYILNQDGTLNSPGNPAKEGSPITNLCHRCRPHHLRPRIRGHGVSRERGHRRVLCQMESRPDWARLPGCPEVCTRFRCTCRGLPTSPPPILTSRIS
ncbi:MAG: hypothetical protein LAQ69_49435 [Acidobacteriia bacterium]|nr:hypothetical protein [Terriglobia bacterium]